MSIKPIDFKDEFYEVKPRCFSYFRAPSSNMLPDGVMRPLDAYHYIRNGEARERQELLRKMTTKTAQHLCERDYFDFVTFTGQFQERAACYQKEESGYMCLEIPAQSVQDVRDKLLSLDGFETVLLFTNALGDGVVWVIKNNSGMEHLDFFRAMERYLYYDHGLDVNPGGKDVARVCYLPYDPEVYINPYYQHEESWYVEQYLKGDGI